MIEHTFSVSQPADLDVAVSSGSLIIETGRPGTVVVTIDTKDPEGWRVQQTGDAIAVMYERGLVGRGGRALVRIVAPEGSSLRARTASADIRALLDLDRVSLSSASGEVRLQDVGSGTIKTASGDVALGHVATDLTVRSASGDVRAVSVTGALAATTASGDLFVEQARGPLNATSASGDLRVGLYVGDDLEATTMSGDVTVGLPAGRTVKLRANTMSGSVRLPERRAVEAAGGPAISVGLKSVSGDITIRRVD